MYASVVVWTLTPCRLDRALAHTQAHVLPLVERQPGFIVCYVVRSSRDAYVTVIVHETREQADAGYRELLPLLRRFQGELLTGMDRYAGEVALAVRSGTEQPTNT